MADDSNGNGVKAYEGAEAEARSVIEQPKAPTSNNPVPSLDWSSQLFWLIGQWADEIAPWGKGKIRDGQLRSFITQENIFASALGIICSRNAGFSWKIDGPPRTVSKLQYIFDTANMGEGWHDLVIKTSIDLYTQDYGAFWEIVREEDSETSPVIGINHLDAARCWHTGNRQAPVVYMDRNSKYHLLKWYNVVTFAEMPVPVEGMYGLQYCVLTRLLRSMQTIRNINTYKYEKTGGRFSKAIHLVKGITSQQLKDAMDTARASTDAQGLSRYMPPVVVGTLDPKADVGHDTIELAGMPDGYDEEITFKHYINQIAMAFESDYQEFAPLPGGGLGTGAQSEMLHLKSQGKGPGLFMKLITHAINFRILPQNAHFFYDEQDLEAEKNLAEVKNIRAQTREIRIQSGEITPQVARQIANDEGDLPKELMDLMNEQDVTENRTVDDSTPADYATQDQGKPIKPGQPAPQTPQQVRVPSAGARRATPAKKPQ